MRCGGDFICARTKTDSGQEVKLANVRFPAAIQSIISGLGLAMIGSDQTNEMLTYGYSLQSLTAIKGLRFALATKPEMSDMVRRKLSGGEKLRIGTEYPNTLENSLGAAGLYTNWGGKSEGMIDYYGPENVDAIFGLVRSGQTLADNNLIIVEDDIEQVNLMCLVADWADDVPLSVKLPRQFEAGQILSESRLRSERLLANAGTKV